MRQAVVQQVGLVTRPNQYGVYPPGALSQAQNVCFRAPGLIEGFSATSTLLSAVAGSGYSVKKIWTDGWADGATTLSASYLSGTTWTLTRGTTPITSGLSATPQFPTGYCNGTFVRDRYLITDTHGPMVLDSVSDTTVRYAGFSAPRAFEKSSTTTVNAAALPTGKVCAWRCFFKRVVGSYEITGPVSNLFAWNNTTGSTVDMTLRVKWPNENLVLEDDTIEVYRTLQQDSGTDTGDDEFLSMSYRITATDAANRFADIRDHTTEAALGASLYTNSDQEGLTKTKAIPPTATDITTFKGYTFYVATEVANSIQLRVPGEWGALTTASGIKFGIGTRTKTLCTITITDPVILVPDTTGLDVGQRVTHARFASGTTILSIVANTSVTCSTNATGSTAAATVFFTDMLEVSGESTVASSLLNVITSLNSGHTRIAVDQTLLDSSAGSQDLIGANIRLYNPYGQWDTCTVRGTNGANYSPPIPALAATVQSGSKDPRTNRLIYSELDQPEACPEVNEVLVGRGVIYRIIPTRDALWVFASDGLWRLSGEGGEWRVDPVDLTLILAAPNGVDVLRETIWALTNRGLVAINDTEIREITNQVIDDLIPGAAYQATFNTFLACDQDRQEIWVQYRSGGASTSYVYNVDQKCWSTFSDGNYMSAMASSPSLRALVYGTNESSTPNIVKFLQTTARTGTQILQFQPIMGDGDPSTLKQFQDLTYIFSNISSPITVTPYWDGVAATALVTKVTNVATGLAGENRVTFGVPRNQAVQPMLRPGLSFSLNQPWVFRGFSVRWDGAAEESLR